MTQVPASVGQPYLRPDAAVAYQSLSAAFAKQFGSALGLTEAYRDLARQKVLYAAWLNHTGSLAAVPGTSNHGWGLACDFGSSVDVAGSAQKKWMDANAPAFGWQPKGNGFNPVEPWHFEYDGTYNPGNTNEEEDDMIRLTHCPNAAGSGADEYIVIDHGQHSYWSVPNTEMLGLLRAQGINEIKDRQGRQIIAGYKKIS